MSDSSCGFCLDICKKQPNTSEDKHPPQEQEKISLKGAVTHPKKSISKNEAVRTSPPYQGQEKQQSTTERNRYGRDKQRTSELTLFKRKMEIEKQIKQMNKSIIQLNQLYQFKVGQLRDIQTSLQGLINR